MKLGQWIGEESLRRQQRQWQRRRQTTDKLWSEKLTWAFESGELKQRQRDKSIIDISSYNLLTVIHGTLFRD